MGQPDAYAGTAMGYIHFIVCMYILPYLPSLFFPVYLLPFTNIA